VAPGTEIHELKHDNYAYSAAFNPDGTKLATGSEDRLSRIWSLHADDIICDACSRLACNLTSQEWQENTATNAVDQTHIRKDEEISYVSIPICNRITDPGDQFSIFEHGQLSRT
jgi:WD40 repeat protein